MYRVLIALSVAASVASASVAAAQPLPKRVGACALTAVDVIGTRLEDPAQPNQRPNATMGTSVSFSNGGFQVSYEYVAAIDHSRRGDRVRICLASIPKHCPPGDDRGRIYHTVNLRTHAAWRLPDSQHSCGGA